MKIETKLDIGQRAHFIYDNKAINAEVLLIKIIINQRKKHCLILYDVGLVESFEESEVHASKEDLLKSL